MALFKSKKAADAPEEATVEQKEVEEAPVIETEAEETDDDKGVRVYELGYQIMSSVAEDAVGVEVETLKSIIAKHGGQIISEGNPELIDLAYTIRKRFESGYQKFDRAHFGWVKFEMNGDKLSELKADIDEVESVIRYIVVKTVRENTIYGPEVMKALKAEEEVDEIEAGDIPKKSEAPKTKTAEEEKEEKGEVVEEELDEKLDELVSDDKVEEEKKD